MIEDLKDMAKDGDLPDEAIKKLQTIEDVTQQRLVILQIASRAGWGTGTSNISQ